MAQNFVLAEDTPFFGFSAGTSAFADIDNDGDNDFIIAGNRRETSLPQSQNYLTILYKNDGAGNFEEQLNTPFAGLEQGAIAFADVDGDNDQDVMITGIDFSFTPQTDLYLNDGDGNFSPSPSDPFVDVYSSDIAFADVDGDGDLDVFVSGSTVAFQAISNTSLYINDGSGSFTTMADTPFANVQEAALDVSDIDADGDLDIVVLGTSEEPGPITQVYNNDGFGNYVISTGYDFEQLSGDELVFSDIDNDGDEDLLIAGTTDGGLTPFTRLYVNDGSGQFSEDDRSILVELKFASAIFCDFDNDGYDDLLMCGKNSTDPNLFIAEGKETILYMNDGTGAFERIKDHPFTNVDLGHLSYADVDGDDFNDVFLIGNSDQGVTFHSELYLNNRLNSSTKEGIVSADMAIYPNPSYEGVIHLDLSAYDGTFTHGAIVDLVGNTIQPITKLDPNEIVSLDISGLPSGTYLVMLHSSLSTTTQKIVVFN